MTSIQTINDEKTVSEVVETSFEPTEITYTSTSAFTVPPRTSDVTSVIVSAVPSTVASVVTSTSPPQVYVSVGTTEITKFITAPGGNRGNEPQTQPPVFQVITSVYDGKVETFVDKGTPQTMVKSDGGVYTVAFTPPLQTIVTHEGGQATQMVITVTPSPEVAFVAVPTTKDGTPTVVVVPSTLNPAGAGAFKEMATTINGKATVVDVPVTQEPVLLAVQTIIDGTPTVLWINSVPTAGFSPISLTLVSEIGGITGVFTTIDPLETTKTTIDGKETTIIRTPGPRTFTSVSGGTLTTMTIITTPTGTLPLSFTVITTIGGTLSTIISTPTPTSFTTSLSGTLRTITSTPSPTTRLSTIKPSTTLITSTTKPTATDSPDRVITEIEKFGFTNGDYFVGKFLPIILAVMIAVPLRIIDLNAKLYQPFHALAQKGGSLGKSSMTLQFDGWKGFLTPFESIAIISPYYNMGRRSQPPEKSILLTRPTNGFYGLYAAILESNIILMLAAFMSILAEFLPILFANVPYNLTQTLKSHNVCATISLTILALMLASMVASLFIKWPELPVDPRSIAGALYYVAESRMLEDFEGLSKLDSEEREKKVKELGRRYFYGGLTGSNGKRMGVESVESVEDTAYTGGHWFLPPQEDQQGDEDNRGEEVQQSESPHQPEQTLRLERRKEVNQGEDIDRGAVLPERARPLEAKQGSEGFS
ncbi:hypothetical protein COL154_010476 [Colletotrichum chrysophilum]|nr:hypothetical protein COL154_010476 [Colletotrichum chrysophilum]